MSPLHVHKSPIKLRTGVVAFDGGRYAAQPYMPPVGFSPPQTERQGFASRWANRPV